MRWRWLSRHASPRIGSRSSKAIRNITFFCNLATSKCEPGCHVKSDCGAAARGQYALAYCATGLGCQCDEGRCVADKERGALATSRGTSKREPKSRRGHECPRQGIRPAPRFRERRTLAREQFPEPLGNGARTLPRRAVCKSADVHDTFARRNDLVQPDIRPLDEVKLRDARQAYAADVDLDRHPLAGRRCHAPGAGHPAARHHNGVDADLPVRSPRTNPIRVAREEIRAASLAQVHARRSRNLGERGIEILPAHAQTGALQLRPRLRDGPAAA